MINQKKIDSQSGLTLATIIILARVFSIINDPEFMICFLLLLILDAIKVNNRKS